MQNTLEQTISGRTLNINLSKVMDSTVSIGTLCTDIFTIIISMREEQNLGTPEALRKLLNHYLDMFVQNCQEIGVDSGEVEAVRYALIALIDETILSIPGECQEQWCSRPLQFECYGEQIAGFKFFDDLQKLSDKASSHYEALETFYYCMALGFQGKYLGKTDEREKVIRQLATILLNTRKRRGTPRKKTAAIQRRPTVSYNLPTWVVILITLAVLISVWIGTSLSINSFSKKTVSSLSSWTDEKKVDIR